MIFKPGDQVRCINTENMIMDIALVEGKVYKVSGIEGICIFVEGIDFGFYADRFVKHDDCFELGEITD